MTSATSCLPPSFLCLLISLALQPLGEGWNLGLVPSWSEVNTFVRLNLAASYSQPTFFFFRGAGPEPPAATSLSLSGGACHLFLLLFVIFYIKPCRSSARFSWLLTLLPFSALQINFRVCFLRFSDPEEICDNRST